MALLALLVVRLSVAGKTRLVSFTALPNSFTLSAAARLVRNAALGLSDNDLTLQTKCLCRRHGLPTTSFLRMNAPASCR